MCRSADASGEPGSRLESEGAIRDELVFRVATLTDRKLLFAAYQTREIKRLRLLISAPICIGVTALATWFFSFRDGGGGSTLSWAIGITLGGMLGYFIYDLVTDDGIDSIIRGLLLTEEQKAQVRASLERSTTAQAARSAAGAAMKQEFEQGVEAARDRVG